MRYPQNFITMGAIIFLLNGISMGAIKVNLIETVSSENPELRFSFLEFESIEDQKNALLELSEHIPDQPGSQSLANESSNRGSESMGSNNPVIVQNRTGSFMARENAGRDFLGGVGMCIGAFVFISVAGEDMSTAEPQGGFYASAGSKVIQGPLACLPGSLMLGGLFFMAKGFFELFMTPDEYSKKTGLKTSEEIILSEQLIVTNRKQLSFADQNELQEFLVYYRTSLM